MLKDSKVKQMVKSYMEYKKLESSYEALSSLMNNVESNLQVETNLDIDDFLEIQNYFHRYDFEIGKVNNILFSDLRLKSNIKELLEEKDISIKELSRKADLTYSNAHKLVNRDYLDNTYLETLVKVAIALDVEVDNLYDIKEKYKEEMKMNREEVKRIKAQNLVKVFDLFDSEEEEKVFLEKSKEENLEYILYIDENTVGTIAESKNNSANDIFFDVYVKDLSVEDLEELEGEE